MSSRWLGRSLRRLEDPPLLRGSGRFTDDYTLPRQLHACFVRSPYAHARVVGLQLAQARHADGVVAVLTGADYLSDGGKGIDHAPVPADAIDYQQPAFSGALNEPHIPLAIDEVRYQGEAVAVVIAATAALAHDAAALVDVEYEPLPAVVDRHGGRIAVDAHFGDRAATEAALQTADFVIEHTFRNQRIANAQMEPRSAIGDYDAESQTYTMIAGSQGAVRQRTSLAAALGVPVDHVRVITPDVGGGFGPRTSLYPEQVIVAWAARRVGRPVRWTSSRSEAFLTDFQGRDSVTRARLAMRADGRILALDADLVFNVGGRTNSYVPLSNAARILPGVYDIAAAHAQTRAVLTNTVPTGPFRGAGRPEATYVLERLLDVAASQMSIDRIELRRRNIIRREQLPYRTAMGLTFDSGDFLGNMQRALELSEWTRSRQRGSGIGLANYVEAPVGAPHERVAVSVRPEGVVDVIVGTQSTGQGHATAFAQVLADRLGIDPGCVRLITGDTQHVIAGGGTHSDRSMRLVGTLLVQAAEQLLRQAESVRQRFRRSLDLWEISDIEPLSAEASFTGRIPAHPTGCAVCEVRIDNETGAIAIERYTTVDDVGQPINPAIVHGQVHGGIVHGLGQTLRECIVFDPASAQNLTASFGDYALLRASDVPSFAAELREDPTDSNPLRIKGAGEAGITPSLAAVTNAVADALGPGAQEVEMPLTAESVWQALR